MGNLSIKKKLRVFVAIGTCILAIVQVGCSNGLIPGDGPQMQNNLVSVLPIATPTLVSPSIQNISSSELAGHACAVRSDGKVQCWGTNFEGQLGITSSDSAEKNTPTLVAGLPAIKQVSSGATHTCAVTLDGKLYCWGSNHSGESGPSASLGATNIGPSLVSAVTDAVQVACGNTTTCVLSSSGVVRCFGNNAIGSAGIGTPGAPITSPNLPVAELPTNIQMISAGQYFMIALTQDGKVFTWGFNNNGLEGGALGNGTTTATASAVSLRIPESVVEVSAGRYMGCAVGASGKLYCWGFNGDYALGIGPGSSQVLTPTQVTLDNIEPVSHVAVGFRHTCVVSSVKRVLCWGSNWGAITADSSVFIEGPQAGGSFVWLSGSSASASYSQTPVEIWSANSPILGITAGAAFTCAHTGDEAKCWGGGNHGSLGDGSNISRAFTGASVSFQGP